MTQPQLNKLIGKELSYANRRCRVVEYLQDKSEVSLVLQDLTRHEIQANRHGDAHRRVPETHTVPWTVRNEAGESAPNPALRELWQYLPAV